MLQVKAGETRPFYVSDSSGKIRQEGDDGVTGPPSASCQLIGINAHRGGKLYPRGLAQPAFSAFHLGERRLGDAGLHGQFGLGEAEVFTPGAQIGLPLLNDFADNGVGHAIPCGYPGFFSFFESRGTRAFCIQPIYVLMEIRFDGIPH